MKKVFEILSMVTLIIWGGMFLYFFFSERVNTYLTPTFRPLVLIAGIGMILLGCFNLINANRKTGACIHDHAGGDDHSKCDHHHDHGDDDHHHHEEATASSLFFALLVLLVPLLTAAKFSPDRYSGEYTIKWAEIETEMHRLKQRKAAQKRSSESVENSDNPYTNPSGGSDNNQGGEEWGEFTLEDLKEMVPQTSAGDFLLDIPQIFYTAGDQELMEVMEGISVQAEAQIIEDTLSETSSPNRLRAFRMMIECCAADGRPLSIPIDFAEAVPAYKEMGWYKLIGRLHFHKGENSEYTPILQMKSFEEIPEPEDWMSLY